MAIDSMRKAYTDDQIRELIYAKEKAERDELSRIRDAERRGRKEAEEQVLKAEEQALKAEERANRYKARLAELGLLDDDEKDET